MPLMPTVCALFGSQTLAQYEPRGFVVVVVTLGVLFLFILGLVLWSFWDSPKAAEVRKIELQAEINGMRNAILEELSRLRSDIAKLDDLADRLDAAHNENRIQF